MKATTIKLEGELLEKLSKAKPKGMSLTAFVKEVLSGDLERKKLREAGVEYAAFLRDSPEVYREERDWEEASLSQPPRTRKKKR